MTLEQLADKPLAQVLADYRRIRQARNAPARPINRPPAVRDWLLVASAETVKEPPHSPFMHHKIVQAVADEFGITVMEIKSNRRPHHTVMARQCCYVLLRMLTKLSYPQMGVLFGKDHSTIQYSIKHYDAKPNPAQLFRIKKIMEALG